jgi:hypothetical protein
MPFFGFLSFMPFLGMAIGAVAGTLTGKFTDAGIDDRFIRDVQGKIKPLQSGLFLLKPEVQLDQVLPAVEPYHPEVLQTSLSSAQEAPLREALNGAPAAVIAEAFAVADADATVMESISNPISAVLASVPQCPTLAMDDVRRRTLHTWDATRPAGDMICPDQAPAPGIVRNVSRPSSAPGALQRGGPPWTRPLRCKR